MRLQPRPIYTTISLMTFKGKVGQRQTITRMRRAFHNFRSGGRRRIDANDT